MRDVSYFSKIYLAVSPVDFRKQVNGLTVIIKEHLGQHPFEAKSLFVFVNRRKAAIRMVYWDQTGFALWSKALEKDTFKWPNSDQENQIRIAAHQLKWLLQGVDVSKIKTHEHLKFDETF
jgi:transposase